jgi:nitroimidazol reductase NimA-like FMN-containing flavoprotein (pyridoxamine 5'-phosphate oxidase superfamily)
VEVDRNGLEVLDPAECLRLLGTATIGRVGTSFGALPVILPVNYRVLDGRIVFRTGAGTKLQAAARDAVVAFEADSIDPISHAGWSVVVTGFARELTDAAALAEAAAANIPRWAPNGNGHVVEITTELITGRRIAPGHRSIGAEA